MQLSRLALHAQNHYLVVYDLGVAICSLAQSKGGRLIERMTAETKKDIAGMVPQLRPEKSSGKLNHKEYIVIGEFVTVHSQENTLGAFHV